MTLVSFVRIATNFENYFYGELSFCFNFTGEKRKEEVFRVSLPDSVVDVSLNSDPLKETGIQGFCVPQLNWSARNLTEMIDWKS